VVSAGASAGVLAANERLLRLTGGIDLIGAQSRFVAGTATGLTVGQVGSAAVLALLPVAFSTFAVLMTVSGLVRLVLATRIEVSATWSTATAAFDVAELAGGRRGEPGAAGTPRRPRLPDEGPARVPPPARPPDDRGGEPG
jgi:hypothetical protein